MTTVYLSYSNDNFVSETKESFVALWCYEEGETIRIQGRTTRQNDFSNKLADKKVWRMKLGANELYVVANKTYMDAFFKAGCWKYSDDNWATETIVVLEQSGVPEWKYAKGHKGLPSIEITLIQQGTS